MVAVLGLGSMTKNLYQHSFKGSGRFQVYLSTFIIIILIILLIIIIMSA